MSALNTSADVVAPAISFRNLTLGYDGHPAVHHLRGTVRPGSLLALVGPNGSGKSTLLKGMMGELAPLEGAVDIEARPDRRIAYLPQQATLDRSFPITVGELVTLGAWSRMGLFGGVTAATAKAVQDAIAAVGLEGFESRPIDRLSGGQLQRALFARVLVQDAPIILLDEPFNAIDSRTCADLMALIEGWHGERRTVIAVLHDLELVRGHFPEALLLAREAIAWGATTSVLNADNLRAARQMAERWDEEAAECNFQPANDDNPQGQNAWAARW